MKLLTNRKETQGLTFYMTLYATKKQGKTYNTSALWAKGLAYRFQNTEYTKDLQDWQQQLLFQAVNILNKEQEIAAPLCMSYLMGWGDTYHSHHYITLYTLTIYHFTLAAWPDLHRYK